MDGDRVYLVPVNYVFDGRHIISHSMTGKKIRLMRENPNVCFEVDDMKSFTHWRSVIAWGQFQEITGERERYEAMKLLLDHTLRTKFSETAVPAGKTGQPGPQLAENNSRPVIYRIVLEEMTGRYESD